MEKTSRSVIIQLDRDLVANTEQELKKIKIDYHIAEIKMISGGAGVFEIILSVSLITVPAITKILVELIRKNKSMKIVYKGKEIELINKKLNEKELKKILEL